VLRCREKTEKERKYSSEASQGEKGVMGLFHRAGISSLPGERRPTKRGKEKKKRV